MFDASVLDQDIAGYRLISDKWMAGEYLPSAWGGQVRQAIGLNSEHCSFVDHWAMRAEIDEIDPELLIEGADAILESDFPTVCLAMALLNWVWRWSSDALLAQHYLLVGRTQVLERQTNHPILRLHLRSIPYALAYAYRYNMQSETAISRLDLLNKWPVIMAYEGAALHVIRWLKEQDRNMLSAEKIDFFSSVAAIDHVESGRVMRSSHSEDPGLIPWVARGFQQEPVHQVLGYVLRKHGRGWPLALIRDRISASNIPDKYRDIALELTAFSNTPFEQLQAGLSSARSSHLCLHESSLLGRSPVRAALTVGDYDMAQELLNIRTQSSLRPSWIDDFFLSRIHLGKGDVALSGQRFKKANHIAESYEAIDRIEFEMRSASEVSPLAWSAMMRESAIGISRAVVNQQRWNAMVFCGESAFVRGLRQQAATYLQVKDPITIIGPFGSGISQASDWFASHRSPGGHAEKITVSAGGDQMLIEALLGIGNDSVGLLQRCIHGTIIFEDIQYAGHALQNLLLSLVREQSYLPINSRNRRKLQTDLVFTAVVNDAGYLDQHNFNEDFIGLIDSHLVTLCGLTERPDDILAMARYFFRSEGMSTNKLNEQLISELTNREWSGNLPQLMAFLRQGLPVKRRKSDASVANESITKFFQVPKQKESVDDRVIAAKQSPREQRLVKLRSLLGQYERLTRKMVINCLNVSPATASVYLGELCDEGILRKVEPTAAPRTHYYVRGSGASGERLVG